MLKFSIPCMLSQLVSSLYNIVDQIFIGNSELSTLGNAALMLALPEERRSAILGFLGSACSGGMALSALIYGFLGELFPLYIVFTVGGILSLAPMIYLCFHKQTKKFVIENCD